MISAQAKLKRCLSIFCCKVNLKFVMFSLLGITLFVLVIFLSLTSKSLVDVDMSIRMKGNVAKLLKDFASFSSVKIINGTSSSTSLRAPETKQISNAQLANSDFKDNGGRAFINNFTTEYKMVSDTGHNMDISTKIRANINKYGNKVNTNNNVRQNSCSLCFEHNFNYVIQNEMICKTNSDEDIDLLILIFTAHENKASRAALRTTWLTFTKNNTAQVRYAFLLGETKNIQNREAVSKENEEFHDIIKEDFIDTYTNLTYKTVMGFKWAATKCAHARYVMKTDDDMYVNIPNLLKVLKGPVMKELNSSVIGACSIKASPIRDRNSKWFASLNSYPEKSYPGVCSGTGYVTSMHVVTAVYKISPNVPFFHLEDVYVSLCIKKLGYKLKPIPGFHIDLQKMDPCVYQGDTMITSHRLTSDMLKSIWIQKCRRA